MLREMTQFSMTEFLAFRKDADEMGVSFKPITSRQKYMMAFRQDLDEARIAADVAKVGGLKNVQRVRVLGDKMGIERFDLVPKLPVEVLRRQQRTAMEKERAEKRGKAMAALVLAALLLPEPPPKRPKKQDAAERRRFLMSSEGKQAAYSEAVRQDRRQRIQSTRQAEKKAA